MNDNDLLELETVLNELDYDFRIVRQAKFVGNCDYYHYSCDDFNDIGWGCGYRTLQTLCSWVRNRLVENKINKSESNVPNLIEIQRILHSLGDKPANFVNSKQWIGCFEASLVIDHLYDVPCKILHCSSGSLKDHVDELFNHFEKYKSPIMMGGDLDSGSKGILGIMKTNESQNDPYILVADPHLSSKIQDKSYLIENGWIKWKRMSEVENTQSFYNFCMPILKN